MKAQVKSKLNLENRIALQDVIPLETPYLIYLDPSSVCNFHCKFCPSGHKELIDNVGYSRSVMSLTLFKKTIDSLSEFNDPIKVLRMNKIGEPLLNKQISEMVAYAKQSGRVEFIDFATNASLLDEKIINSLIDAGLDRLNLSIEGINREQYKEICHVDIDFNKLVNTIKLLYKNKGNCEITIKIPGNYLSEEEVNDFFEIFGNYCDRIFVENLTSIWPGFDMHSLANLNISEASQYGDNNSEKKVCSYIFYSMAINADGSVSACCPDWAQKIIIGDINTQSLKEIWNSNSFNNLRIAHLNKERFSNTTCAECGHIKYSQVDDIDKYSKLLLTKFMVKDNRGKSE